MGRLKICTVFPREPARILLINQAQENIGHQLPPLEILLYSVIEKVISLNSIYKQSYCFLFVCLFPSNSPIFFYCSQRTFPFSLWMREIFLRKLTVRQVRSLSSIWCSVGSFSISVKHPQALSWCFPANTGPFLITLS